MAKPAVASNESSRWQWITILVLFLVAAFFGFVGQILEPPHPSPPFSVEWWRAVSDDIFITILYFTFSAPVDAAGSNVFLHIARFLAPMATVSAIIKIIIQAAYASWIQARLRYRHDHIVVVGFGVLGQQIARHFHHHGKQVVALDIHPLAEATELSDRLNIPLVVGDGTNASDLREVAANHASAIFIVTDNDIVNLEASAAASSIMSQSDKQETRLLVHLGNLDLSRQLEDYERRLAFIGDRTTSVSFFNYNDLLARQLLALHPFHEIATLLAQDRLHVLVIGLDDISEKLIQHTILSQRTANLETPAFTIVDKNAAEAEERFAHKYPGLKDVADMTFVAVDPRRVNLMALVRSQSTRFPLTATVLSFAEEVQNLTAALEIHAASARGLLHAGQIMVRRAQTSDFFELLSKIERYDLTNMLHDFGEGDYDLFVAQISGDSDDLAKQIHDAYCRERREAGDPPGPTTAPWAELPESNRRANRRAADHLWTKLASAGYACTGPRLGIPTLKDGGARLTDPAIRASLAKLEHDRWWCDRVIDGWAFAEHRSNEARHHPMLKPFEDLSPEEQEKDGEQVDFLAETLAAASAETAGKTRAKSAASPALDPEVWIGLSFGGDAQTPNQPPEDAADTLLERYPAHAFFLIADPRTQSDEAWLKTLVSTLVSKQPCQLLRLFDPEIPTEHRDFDADDGMWLNLSSTGSEVSAGQPAGLTSEAYFKKRGAHILTVR